MILAHTVRPEPFGTVRPELVEGMNGAQDRPVEEQTVGLGNSPSSFDRGSGSNLIKSCIF
jgi:hypothetical protein